MLARIGGITFLLIALVALGGRWSSHATHSFSLSAKPRLSARLLPSDEAETARTIRFLSARVGRDPDDFVAQNMLAGYFLQRLRETSNVDYLRLARHAAQTSLASVPTSRNPGGLSLLAHAEFSAHDFVLARDHAIELTRMEPAKGEGWALLGDAQLELGNYGEAMHAFEQMQTVGYSGSGAHTRLARLALLKGDPLAAHRHLVQALAFALNDAAPARETVAWCYWQLGEVAFSAGDYAAAEEHYRSALTTFPDYINALPSLGRVRAARGDLREAIQHCEHAVGILPDPAFVAALGDLYKLAGRESEATARYELVEKIGLVGAATGGALNRQLVLYHADHDIQAGDAYRDALAEYQVRKDIYGADAVAWSALKAGKLAEAREASKSSLRMGTRDARLFYHAGMIARAAGDKAESRDYIERALAINSGFDPMQAKIAKEALGR